MLPSRIVIADSQYLTRVGLRLVLQQYPGIEVLGEVTQHEELHSSLKSKHPDILILDYHEPSHFGPEAVSKVKTLFPGIRVLVISSDNDKDRIMTILKQGAEGYLTKSCEDTEIYDAIKALMKGNHFYCNKVLNLLLAKSFDDQAESEDCSPTVLSPRELEIVKLAAAGKVAKEIGQELNLSTHTVYTHRKNILRKLNLKTPTDLIRYAYRSGISDAI